ncbi:MAG: hypothetical protein M0R22_04260 [Dehalococcoidia bacterium]|nr:hypothetical protein [Dehalococcoidia bacterium]
MNSEFDRVDDAVICEIILCLAGPGPIYWWTLRTLVALAHTCRRMYGIMRSLRVCAEVWSRADSGYLVSEYLEAHLTGKRRADRCMVVTTVRSFIGLLGGAVATSASSVGGLVPAGPALALALTAGANLRTFVLSDTATNLVPFAINRGPCEIGHVACGRYIQPTDPAVTRSRIDHLLLLTPADGVRAALAVLADETDLPGIEVLSISVMTMSGTLQTISAPGRRNIRKLVLSTPGVPWILGPGAWKSVRELNVSDVVFSGVVELPELRVLRMYVWRPDRAERLIGMLLGAAPNLRELTLWTVSGPSDYLGQVIAAGPVRPTMKTLNVWVSVRELRRLAQWTGLESLHLMGPESITGDEADEYRKFGSAADAAPLRELHTLTPLSELSPLLSAPRCAHLVKITTYFMGTKYLPASLRTVVLRGPPCYRDIVGVLAACPRIDKLSFHWPHRLEAAVDVSRSFVGQPRRVHIHSAPAETAVATVLRALAPTVRDVRISVAVETVTPEFVAALADQNPHLGRIVITRAEMWSPLTQLPFPGNRAGSLLVASDVVTADGLRRCQL